MAKFSSTDDIIDVSDITDRVDELIEAQTEFEHDDDGNRNSSEWASAEPDDAQELAILQSLLSDIEGAGGDHQWNGDWYPSHLIHEAHFTAYCEELVKDIDAIPRNVPDYIVIDWRATANNLRVDYTEVEFSGETFLCR